MAVTEVIGELIEKFRRNAPMYLRQTYNETETRVQFINPFFTALGWDVDNERGEFEVTHEGRLSHAATAEGFQSHRAPDYIFWHGPLRRFVVEAKKPYVNIKGDAGPALQVRSYGWSAQVPLGIVTDFEEFAIYDTRYAPKKSDKVDTAIYKYYRYESYVENWDEIAALFSREAVANGSLDQFVQEHEAPKGTLPVDAAFLSEIERWRADLAKNIASWNPQLDVRQLNRIVQMTIDRIIFLRFCEARGIEQDERLKKLLEGGGGIYGRLTTLFQQADERYNSGLFHFKKEPGHDNPDDADLRVTIGDDLLRNIITKLYFPEGPYAFGVIPVEIIGQVYEQFLGKVIALNPATKRAEVEDKPEVRKAGGVYYTPQFIVDYIVEHTVGKLVKGKQPKQIANLKILDPACGSGSFLVGAYSFLLNWYRKWYVAHSPEKYKDEMYDLGGGQWRLTTKAKRDILTSHIYGVDIDTQAMEVTRLSLMLKMLEDESNETLQYRLFTLERVLPNLDDNIKCGNSLIGKDFFSGQTPTAEERRRVNAFDWAAAFPTIMQAGGFDAVIGNPPYIRIQTMIDEPQGKQILDYYKRNYAATSKGNYDIYVIFVEQGLHLLNKGGRLGFIMPQKFWQVQYGEALRGYLADGEHVAEVVSFANNQVFDAAFINTCILILSKTPQEMFHYTEVSKVGKTVSLSTALTQARPSTLTSSVISAGPWVLKSADKVAVMDKMKKQGSTLEQCTSRIFQGLKTSADKIYVMELISETGTTYIARSAQLGRQVEIECEMCHKLIKGTEMRPFAPKPVKRIILFPYVWSGNAIKLIGEAELAQQFPMTYAYLKENEGYLRNREDGSMNVAGWYGYGRTQALDVVGVPKLITPDLAPRSSFLLDTTGELFILGGAAGGYGILPKPEVNPLYLVGLLNSRILNFFITSSGQQVESGYYSFEARFIRSAPIRTLDLSNPAEKAQHDRIVQLVQQMLDLKQQEAAGALDNPTREIMRDIDWAIDELVYQLYGLTAEEIKIVEAATKG